MAKASVTCTCKNCGKTFEVSTVKQNRREADRWESWAASAYTECDECRKERLERERAEENAKAAETTSERKYPTLDGSEKQVAWANTIRLDYMNRIEEKIAICTEEEVKIYREMQAFILRKYVSARFWIDHRDNYYSIDRQAVKDYKAEQESLDKIAQEMTAEASEQPAPAPAAEPKVNEYDIVTAPENQTHAGAVEIRITEDQVSAKYVKDDDFRELVKSLDYRWVDGAWRKTINSMTGSAAERAAELGNKLLNAGYAINIPDPAIRAAAINGEYEPQTYRWIGLRTGGEYAGWLNISWNRPDDFYHEARALPRARYDSRSVVVPVKNYEHVQDFAQAYGFKFTPAALEAIEKQRALVEKVTPAAAKQAEYDEHNIEDVLNSSREILDDLKDEC